MIKRQETINVNKNIIQDTIKRYCQVLKHTNLRLIAQDMQNHEMRGVIVHRNMD